MSDWVNQTAQQNLLQCQIFHNKSHIHCPGIKPRSLQRKACFKLLELQRDWFCKY